MWEPPFGLSPISARNWLSRGAWSEGLSGWPGGFLWLGSKSGKEKTHKHKQICGIVPGLGGHQNFVYVFFFGSFLMGERKNTHTHTQTCEVSVLLTLQKPRKNQSDPKVTQKWLGQTDPKATQNWLKSDYGPHFWVNFGSLLSHLGSLWGGTLGVTFESLLGHFNSFWASVDLGARPLLKHKQNSPYPKNLFGLILTSKGYFKISGYLRKCTIKQGKTVHFQGYFSVFGLF